MILDILEFKKTTTSTVLGTAAALRPVLEPPQLERPLFFSRIPAGFPSPADDYIEALLDLNEKFIHNAAATYYVVTEGDSMNQAGVLDGTILCVDKSLEAQHGDIVIAAIAGEFTVKRLYRQSGRVELRPESSNPLHRSRCFSHEDDLVIWGVVSSVHTATR